MNCPDCKIPAEETMTIGQKNYCLCGKCGKVIPKEEKKAE
jgi:hypothetical protein